MTLTQIQSVTHHYDIPFNSELTIWRDDEFRLKGVINGITDDKDALEYKEDGVIKKVGFIDGETLNATSNNEKYLIEGFGLENSNMFAVQEGEKLRLGFSCEVYLDRVRFAGNTVTKTDIICEWYLCSMPRVLFSHTTSRYDSHPNYKVRNDLDPKTENENEHFREGYSSSWDFVIISHNGYKIVLQQVLDDYLPKETDGIVIEYRGIDSNFPSSSFRKMFREYVSFILGTDIQQIGTSEFKIGYVLLSCESENPWKRRIKNNGNINPIPLKNGADRSIFENQLNKLLSNFIRLHEKTSLSECLQRLWIGSNLSIGTNLPIIASGFEVLINSYLESYNIIKKYTKKEKRDYRELISEDLESLRQKLAGYDFAPFVLNKIKNPYNFGIGEKFRIFFESISLNFENDSMEIQALKARNLMTHGRINISSTEGIREIKKISDAYVTLVNRVILKLLDYDWYYVDYSKEGVKYLKMDENM